MGVARVIEREEGLAAVEAFLAGVERAPAALVLSGEPGIGKTVLWEAGVEEAERRFGRVLSCRGVEAEAGLSFAGLSDLLSEVLSEVAEWALESGTAQSLRCLTKWEVSPSFFDLTASWLGGQAAR